MRPECEHTCVRPPSRVLQPCRSAGTLTSTPLQRLRCTRDRARPVLRGVGRVWTGAYTSRHKMTSRAGTAYRGPLKTERQVFLNQGTHALPFAARSERTQQTRSAEVDLVGPIHDDVRTATAPHPAAMTLRRCTHGSALPAPPSPLRTRCTRPVSQPRRRGRFQPEDGAQQD